MGTTKNPTTKERIFIAGIRLFARKGLKGATVRDICKEAGTANATAVNYYFGGKDKLYRAILDLIFAENMKRRKARRAAAPHGASSPDQRLRAYLETMVDVGFSDDPLLKDIIAIIMQVMTQPSDHLDELVENHVRPDAEELLGIIREILGPGAPETLVRDCMASVAGQIHYYIVYWPVFHRVFPEHPGMINYREQLIDHIMRFAMAGLDAVRQDLEHETGPSGGRH